MLIAAVLRTGVLILLINTNNLGCEIKIGCFSEKDELTETIHVYTQLGDSTCYTD